MSATITSLAFKLRTASQATTHPIALRRAHELVAAALGYPTMAAFQASDEAALGFDEVAHLLPDFAMLTARAQGLGVTLDALQLQQLFIGAAKADFPHIQVHREGWELDLAMLEQLTALVENHGAVTGHVADSNADSVDEPDLEPIEIEFAQLPAVGDWCHEATTGHVPLNPHPDLPYIGHGIAVDLEFSYRRTGLRSLASPDIEIIHATLMHH